MGRDVSFTNVEIPAEEEARNKLLTRITTEIDELRKQEIEEVEAGFARAGAAAKKKTIDEYVKLRSPEIDIDSYAKVKEPKPDEPAT